MIRGTTPSLTLTIPNGGDLDLTQAEAVYVTLRRRERTLTITGEDLSVEPHAVTFRLSQAESLELSTGEAEVQLNWVYRDAVSGELCRGATLAARLPIRDQLLQEVIP